MKNQNLKPLRNAGLVLGVGLGGFLDGIIFHQILQIHNMLSNRYFPDTLANEQLNMFWDGWFHVAVWTATVIGISLLWKTAKNKDVPLDRNYFLGSMLMGWGLFNFVEGMINHQILQLHHVVERATGAMELVWDLAFLASGVLLGLIGWWLMRREQMTSSSVRAAPLRTATES